ncbi:MAG: Lrp/AsnC family transcriptional regulator [Microbacteriaceae bacterium]|nr:Lrp/AsnC family transcriptional regulator [Microbacteriaceae bacterium]
MELDDIDLAILGELKRDGRASMSAIAQATHISRASAYARVARLTDAGVITGFSARVDPVRAGQRSSAYVALSIDQSPWQELRAQLIQIPEIAHIALVGGEVDILLLVRARDNHDLRRVVLEQLQAIPAVRSTRTWLIFEDFDPEDER